MCRYITIPFAILVHFIVDVLTMHCGNIDHVMWMYGPSIVDVLTMHCGDIDHVIWMYGPSYVDVWT